MTNFNYFNFPDLENSVKGKTIEDIRQYKDDNGYALFFTDGSSIDFRGGVIFPEDSPKGVVLIDGGVEPDLFRERGGDA